MAIKDKFSTPANEAAGIIDELSIDHHIQEEFPNLASSNGEDVDLSMSEYAAAAGIAAGAPIKFSDMFGLSNFDKFYLKPGYKKQWYKLATNFALSPHASTQYGFGNKDNYIHFPYVYDRNYAQSELGFGKVNANIPAIGSRNTNLKIPGYSRCDIKLLDHAEELNDDHPTLLYTEGYPDIRLDIRTYDEYPRYTHAARDLNPDLYDPHWNWMKITGKWVNRSNDTLDALPRSYYFWRGGAEVKTDTYVPYAVSSMQSWTEQDFINNPSGLVRSNHNQTLTNPRVNKIFESVMPNGIFNGFEVLYWDKPTTMEDVADNYIKFRRIHANNVADYWGTRYADTDRRRDFGFNPASYHGYTWFGGSGTKSYRWAVPQTSIVNANGFAEMYGNPASNKFSDVRFSTNAEHADNEYTIEFLVDHDQEPWKSVNTEPVEYFKYI